MQEALNLMPSVIKYYFLCFVGVFFLRRVYISIHLPYVAWNFLVVESDLELLILLLLPPKSLGYESAPPHLATIKYFLKKHLKIYVKVWVPLTHGFPSYSSLAIIHSYLTCEDSTREYKG